MFVITPGNNRGVLEGPINESIEMMLKGQNMWLDVNDLNNQVFFYADGFMYLGAMSKVSRLLNDANCPCHIELPSLEALDVDWEFKWEYRPRQEDLVNAGLEHRFCMLQAPPGFGKTICMASMTTQIKQRTIIFVDENAPFEQAYTAFLNATNIEPGRLDGTHKDMRDVTICMIQSAYNQLKSDPEGPISQHIKSARVVMVDECHGAAGDSYLHVLNAMIDPQYVIGLSATPEDREDGLQDFVHAFLGEVVFKLGYGDQISDGTACPITVYVDHMPKVEYGLSRLRGRPQYMRNRDYAKVYREQIMYNKVRNMSAIGFAREMITDGVSGALICSKVEHIEEICRLAPEIVPLHSDIKNRKEIIEKLRNKEIMCVATTLFDQATDIPSLGFVALMAAGKSKIKLKQRLRCTRVFAGETALGWYNKIRGFVYMPYDHSDFVEEHSRINNKLLKDLVKEHPDNEYHELKDNG